eukprot:gene3017-3204_t
MLLLLLLALISLLNLNYANQFKIDERLPRVLKTFEHLQDDECLQTRPIFSYHNITRFNWTRDDLKDFHNSHHVKKFIHEHYHKSPGWSKPVVFAVVGDERYTQFIEILMESLQSVNVLPQDLLVACLTTACNEKLTSMSIRNIYYPEPDTCRTLPHDRYEIHKRTRCIVSSIKYQFVLDLLKFNYNVFFLDLDIFVHKFPLPLTIIDRNELYVQYDAWKELNFGCFFIQSNTKTIQSFEETLSLFFWKMENDQRLFTKMIFKNYKYSLLPSKQYYAHHYANINGSEEINNIILTHMTCVEGGYNKALFSRELYGPPSIPSFYHPCYKTVSITYQANYSAEELIGLLMIAVKVCQAYGNRRLRVVGWDYSQGGTFKALYNVDLLFQSQNITMVESRYWENMNRFYPDYEVSRYEWKMVEEMVDESKLPVTSVADIIVEVMDKTLLSKADITDYRPFLCDLPQRYRNVFSCARTCSDYHL